MASLFHHLQLGRVRDLPIGAHPDLDKKTERTTPALAIYGESPFSKQFECNVFKSLLKLSGRVTQKQTSYYLSWKMQRSGPVRDFSDMQ